MFTTAAPSPGQEAPAERKPDPNTPKAEGKQPQVKNKLLLAEGPLQKLSEHVSKVLKLRWKGGRLDLDDDHWEKARQGKTREEYAEEIAKRLIARGLPEEWARRQARSRAEASGLDLTFAQLQKDIGAHGSQERVTQGRKRRSFAGQSLSASYLLVGFDRTITLIEELKPERVLIVKDRVDGMLSVSLIEPTGNMVLILRQDPNGDASVLHVSGREVRRFHGKTFLDLYRRNRTYVDKTLLPVLQEIGVLPPMSIDDPKLAKAAVTRLRHMQDEGLEEEAAELIAQLDSSEYLDRQAAYKKIAENFLRYRDQVQAALKSPKTSREARMRLEKVVADNATIENYGAILEGMKLLDDPGYLVSLLEIAEDDQDRAAVVARLKTVTGQDFGGDAEKWQKWLRRRQDKPSADGAD